MVSGSFFGSYPFSPASAQKAFGRRVFLSAQHLTRYGCRNIASKKIISGDLVVHEETNLNSAVECWRNGQIDLERKGDQIIIQGSIESKEVLIVKLTEK